jgi:hypothetical protein
MDAGSPHPWDLAGRCLHALTEPERRRGRKPSHLPGLPTEEVEEEDAALSIRGPDSGDRARAVGKESQDLSRKGGKRLSQAEAQLPAFQDQDQAVGQGKEHGSLPARKDALIKMIAGRPQDEVQTLRVFPASI